VAAITTELTRRRVLRARIEENTRQVRHKQTVFVYVCLCVCVCMCIRAPAIVILTCAAIGECVCMGGCAGRCGGLGPLWSD
jgi:hypothetical protein